MIDNEDDYGSLRVRPKAGEEYLVEWEVANGHVYMRHPTHSVDPVRLLPTGPDATARWMLKELLKAITLGTAQKK